MPRFLLPIETAEPGRLATQYRLDELDYRVAGNMIAEAWSLAADANLIGAAVDYARRRVAAARI